MLEDLLYKTVDIIVSTDKERLIEREEIDRWKNQLLKILRNIVGKINAIIEILVMGLIALLGISLNIIGFLDINKIEVLKYINEFKSYTNIILLITLAIAYQLGWIINGLTSIAYPSFLKNKAKLKYKIPSGKYSQIRDIVYFKASDNALYKIKERLSGVRLLRSSIINFLIFIVGFSSLDYLNIVFFLLIDILQN